MEKLKNKYEEACNEYAKRFCTKQDMDFDGWVGGQVGGIAMCNDFFFNLHDIVLDLNSKQEKGIIIDWYYDNLENPERYINYFSYTKGLRVADVKQQ